MIDSGLPLTGHRQTLLPLTIPLLQHLGSKQEGTYQRIDYFDALHAVNEGTPQQEQRRLVPTPTGHGRHRTQLHLTILLLLKVF